jgi:hypothetical protein
LLYCLFCSTRDNTRLTCCAERLRVVGGLVRPCSLGFPKGYLCTILLLWFWTFVAPSSHLQPEFPFDFENRKDCTPIRDDLTPNLLPMTYLRRVLSTVANVTELGLRGGIGTSGFRPTTSPYRRLQSPNVAEKPTSGQMAAGLPNILPGLPPTAAHSGMQCPFLNKSCNFCGWAGATEPRKGASRWLQACF